MQFTILFYLKRSKLICHRNSVVNKIFNLHTSIKFIWVRYKKIVDQMFTLKKLVCCSDKDVYFLKNDYPYTLTNVLHYVLWSWNRTLSEKEALQVVNRTFPTDKYEHLLFETPNFKKSVKKIPHLQVFIREKPWIKLFKPILK